MERFFRQKLITSALVAATVGAISATALGGADVHTWDGTSSSNWQTASNWNTSQVPGDGDAAIIGQGFLTTWVTLSANTANLDSVYIWGEMKLFSNGHRIRVGGNPATTRVVQPASVLFIEPEIGTTQGIGIDTDELNLESGGELWMAGGQAVVDERLRIIDDGLITGYGQIDILGSQDGALSAVSGRLEVDGGTLRINMVNGGTMSVPSEIEIFGEGNRLRLDGPFLNPLFNVDMGDGGRLSISEDWELTGTLTAGTNGDSIIDGAGRGTYSGTFMKTGVSTAEIRSEADFPSGGNIVAAVFSYLLIDNLFFCSSGHQTDLATGSRLIFGDGATSFFGWNGDIDMTGGVVELQSQVTFGGDLWMGDGALSVPAFAGVADAVIAGSLVIPANPANFLTDVDFLTGSSVNVQGTGRLRIGTGTAVSTTTISSGATVFGAGEYWIEENGILTADAGEMLNSDLTNEGQLRPGQPTGLFSIGRNYTQASAGVLDIDLAGTGLIEADRVDVGDAASLAGTLNVDLLAGYVPAFGTSFVILTADAVVGEFDQINGPEGMVVEYFSDQVVVTFDEPADCPADLNDDGQVGGADLALLLGDWGPAEGSPADLNGDGQVGGADLALLLAEWGPCT